MKSWNEFRTHTLSFFSAHIYLHTYPFSICFRLVACEMSLYFSSTFLYYNDLQVTLSSKIQAYTTIFFRVYFETIYQYNYLFTILQVTHLRRTSTRPWGWAPGTPWARWSCPTTRDSTPRPTSSASCWNGRDIPCSSRYRCWTSWWSKGSWDGKLVKDCINITSDLVYVVLFKL